MEPPDNLCFPIWVQTEPTNLEERTPPTPTAGDESPKPTPPPLPPPDEDGMEMEPENKSHEPRKIGGAKKRLTELVDTTSSEATSHEEMMQTLSDIIQVTLLPGVAPPIQGSEGSCRANQSVTLQPGQTTKVRLGLQLATPASYAILLCSRSWLASEGITV